jgi:hypothetical protein
MNEMKAAGCYTDRRAVRVATLPAVPSEPPWQTARWEPGIPARNDLSILQKESVLQDRARLTDGDQNTVFASLRKIARLQEVANNLVSSMLSFLACSKGGLQDWTVVCKIGCKKLTNLAILQSCKIAQEARASRPWR